MEDEEAKLWGWFPGIRCLGSTQTNLTCYFNPLHFIFSGMCLLCYFSHCSPVHTVLHSWPGWIWWWIPCSRLQQPDSDPRLMPVIHFIWLFLCSYHPHYLLGFMILLGWWSSLQIHGAYRTWHCACTWHTWCVPAEGVQHDAQKQLLLLMPNSRPWGKVSTFATIECFSTFHKQK